MSDEHALALAGIPGVIIGARWESGRVECDLSGFLCDAHGRVLGESNFVFYNNPSNGGPSSLASVTWRERTGGGGANLDRAQMLVAVTAAPPAAHRLVVCLSTFDRGGLAPVRDIRLRALHTGTGTTLFEVKRDVLTPAAACVLVEVRGRQGGLDFRWVGASERDGLAGLCARHGVAVEE